MFKFLGYKLDGKVDIGPDHKTTGSGLIHPISSAASTPPASADHLSAAVSAAAASSPPRSHSGLESPGFKIFYNATKL